MKENNLGKESWDNEVNINKISNKFGHKEDYEIVNKDIQYILKRLNKQQYKNLINKIQWFKYPQEPYIGISVVIKLENEKLGIGQLDKNYCEKYWLVQCSGKTFRRIMPSLIKKWRWMTNNEMIEYYENKTLKIIENNKEL